jgi:hypothetical protein
LVKEKTWSNLKNKRNLKPVKELKLQINPSNQNPLTKIKSPRKCHVSYPNRGLKRTIREAEFQRTYLFSVDFPLQALRPLIGFTWRERKRCCGASRRFSFDGYGSLWFSSNSRRRRSSNSRAHRNG